MSPVFANPSIRSIVYGTGSRQRYAYFPWTEPRLHLLPWTSLQLLSEQETLLTDQTLDIPPLAIDLQLSEWD